MVWIFDRADLAKHDKLVKELFNLYNDIKNFSDPNERENPRDIINRIKTNSKSSATFLLIVQNLTNSKVIGGAVLEFYSKSKCALLAYIFVNHKDRGTGIAKMIIQSELGLRNGIERWKAQNGQLLHMFLFEVNSPLLTIHDSISPFERLKFFKHMGGKILDIPYIQPPLSTNLKIVENLLLLTFPFLNDDHKEKVPTDIIFTFYKELCLSLNIESSFYHSQIRIIKTYLTKKYETGSFIRFIDI